MSRTYRKVPERRKARWWYKDAMCGDKTNTRRNGRVETIGPVMPDGHWLAGPSCWCEWCRCERKHRVIRQLAENDIKEAVKTFGKEEE